MNCRYGCRVVKFYQGAVLRGHAEPADQKWGKAGRMSRPSANLGCRVERRAMQQRRMRTTPGGGRKRVAKKQGSPGGPGVRKRLGFWCWGKHGKGQRGSGSQLA